jgi:hypothetical protein
METIEKPIYSVQRLPRWIKRNEFDFADECSHPDSPHFFLLVDYQEQVKDREIRSYSRLVQKINDSSRLEEASLFLWELRAGNERIIFHRLDIFRNGRKFSALNPENISVYRREKSLKKHIISNRITVCHSIDDLRVGDIIDMQVTHLEKANAHPMVVKQYHSKFWLDWNCLVLRQNIRIINRSRRTLNLHHHVLEKGKEKNSYVELKPQQECERHFTNLAPKSISGTAPDWLDRDFLQLTSVASWPQISRYFHSIYTDAADRNGDLDCNEVDRIGLTGNKYTDTLRIIRFVQDEIRYQCECDGIYSHVPKPPRYVLRRGAGDCKGKSNLLIVLLDSIGVTANPVLVNTRTGRAINDCKPSAWHFNHVIVRVQMSGKSYYFDPTMQKQSGDFEHAAQLDLGYALNATAAGDDLVKLPLDLSRKCFELRHRLDFRDVETGSGTATITRKYFAQQADKMRYYIASNETREVQQDYFDRAQEDISLYLAVIRPFTVIKDDTDRNLLITEEYYQVTDMDGGYAEDDVEVTTNFHRGFPYADDDNFELQLNAEGGLEHFIEILYPAEIDEKPGCRSFSNPYFSYCNKVWSEGKVLNFHTQVTPLQEVVDHAGITQYHHDARYMYRRRHNIFPRRHDDGSTIWESIGAVLLLCALLAAIIGLLLFL